MLYVIFDEGLEDGAYIDANTNGIDKLRETVAEYDPKVAQKICGIDEDTIRNVARIYAKSKSAMSIWTMGINQSTHGSDGVCNINNLNLITGNIGVPGGTSLSITGQCNAMGTREWSSCAGLPGYRALENAEHRKEIGEFWNVEPDFFPPKVGLKQTDIFPAIETGQIRGLWLVATNPLTSMANQARIRKMMEKLDYLIVQDVYQDVETTQYAHAYFPAAVWAEKQGCHTNTERRVNLTRNALQPYADSKPDFWIFNQMAKRFPNSATMVFPDNTETVFDEMKALSIGEGRTLDISGMSYDKIEQANGIQWPFKEDAEGLKGEPRLYTDGKFQTADGKANLISVNFVNNNECPDEEYPFWMNSGRVVEHFHTRTRTGKIGNINKFSPTPYMEINPDAAQQLGLEQGEYVRAVSRRGDAVVMVQLTHRVPPDMVFIPFHYHDCVNRLTLGLLDPYSRQPAFKQCSVKIEPVDQAQAAQLNLERRAF
jgi:assimilatory nitrate reductase catalytic subunit